MIAFYIILAACTFVGLIFLYTAYRLAVDASGLLKTADANFNLKIFGLLTVSTGNALLGLVILSFLAAFALPFVSYSRIADHQAAVDNLAAQHQGAVDRNENPIIADLTPDPSPGPDDPLSIIDLDVQNLPYPRLKLYRSPIAQHYTVSYGPAYREVHIQALYRRDDDALQIDVSGLPSVKQIISSDQVFVTIPLIKTATTARETTTKPFTQPSPLAATIRRVRDPAMQGGRQ